MKREPNLLVLGASGGVANAFLHRLAHHRQLFNRLILVDKNKDILSAQYIERRNLDYSFIQKKIRLPEQEKQYMKMLRKNEIDIVIDLTDLNAMPVLEATDKAGVSYINTALNDRKKSTYYLVMGIYNKRDEIKNAVHVICSGMNPGCVNLWVRYGIEKFGVPKDVVHFEYDTSKIVGLSAPMITWSIRAFLSENVGSPSGTMLGANRVKILVPNGLEHRVNMRSILSPVLKLDKYPSGFTVLHEENVTIAKKYNVPSKFIYSVNMETMKKLVEIYKRKGSISPRELVHGDNVNRMLEGTDNIGVMLKYQDKMVYYFNQMHNVSTVGTNATYTQVVVGVFAALFTSLFDKLKSGIYFPEDLFKATYKQFVFDNMRVQELVFKKTRGGLKLASFNPEVKVRKMQDRIFI